METVDSNGDGKPDGAVLLDKLESDNAGNASRPLMNATIDTESNSFDIGFDTAAFDEIMTMGDNLLNGLRC
jgi:hypothetical protein